jgi:hypothetical protein
MGDVSAANDRQKRSPWRLMLLAALWMVFGFALIQSLNVAVAWWQGGFQAPGMAEAAWVALFPVLLFVYIRRFTIFRPGCTSCAAPADDSTRHLPRGP